MTLLSLAHFTVLDVGPLELIDIGAQAGYDTVGLRIVPPPGAPAIVPVIGDKAIQRQIRERLSATGMRILDTEAVWLLPETDASSFAEILDTSVEIGAEYLIVCSNDPDRSRVEDNFSKLCESTNEREIRVMLEFMPYTQIRNLQEAHDILTITKPANAGILVDAIHLSRSGGSPRDLAAYDPSLFSFVHICDASAIPPPIEELRAEARGGRLYPGEGALWLKEFANSFPSETTIAIEAPSTVHANLPPRQRATMAADLCRKLLRDARGKAA